MPVRLIAAVATAAVLFGALPIKAADIYSEKESRAEHASPYDDPRYADFYRHPDGRRHVPGKDYAEAPRRYDYNNHYAQPRYGQFRAPCMTRRQIRRHAWEQGWTVIQWQGITRMTATFEAERRVDGKVFNVTVDRCTTKVLAINPVRPRYEDYAWRRGVYDRAY